MASGSSTATNGKHSSVSMTLLDDARQVQLLVNRVVDGVTRADAIDKELAALENLAREQGIVVAAASALPVSIERINRWAQSLDAKKLVIVPVSAARGFRTAKPPASPRTTGSLR